MHAGNDRRDTLEDCELSAVGCAQEHTLPKFNHCVTHQSKTRASNKTEARADARLFLLHHFGHQHRVNHVNHAVAGFDVNTRDF
jgi:hypothetical protein